jgi:hypothetical protein
MVPLRGSPPAVSQLAAAPSNPCPSVEFFGVGKRHVLSDDMFKVIRESYNRNRAGLAQAGLKSAVPPRNTWLLSFFKSMLV